LSTRRGLLKALSFHAVRQTAEMSNKLNISTFFHYIHLIIQHFLQSQIWAFIFLRPQKQINFLHFKAPQNHFNQSFADKLMNRKTKISTNLANKGNKSTPFPPVIKTVESL
jgi:hypothetical protein